MFRPLLDTLHKVKVSSEPICVLADILELVFFGIKEGKQFYIEFASQKPIFFREPTHFCIQN